MFNKENFSLVPKTIEPFLKFSYDFLIWVVNVKFYIQIYVLFFLSNFSVKPVERKEITV